MNRNYFKLITFKILNIQIKNQPNLNSDFNLHQFINFIKNDLTPKFQIKILQPNRFSTYFTAKSIRQANWSKLLFQLKNTKFKWKSIENLWAKPLKPKTIKRFKCKLKKSNYNNCFCCKPLCVRLIRWSNDGFTGFNSTLIHISVEETTHSNWNSWRNCKIKIGLEKCFR